jgi:hypothetical protein
VRANGFVTLRSRESRISNIITDYKKTNCLGSNKIKLYFDYNDKIGIKFYIFCSLMIVTFIMIALLLYKRVVR